MKKQKSGSKTSSRNIGKGKSTSGGLRTTARVNSNKTDEFIRYSNALLSSIDDSNVNDLKEEIYEYTYDLIRYIDAHYSALTQKQRFLLKKIIKRTFETVKHVQDYDYDIYAVRDTAMVDLIRVSILFDKIHEVWNSMDLAYRFLDGRWTHHTGFIDGLEIIQDSIESQIKLEAPLRDKYSEKLTDIMELLTKAGLAQGIKPQMYDTISHFIAPKMQAILISLKAKNIENADIDHFEDLITAVDIFHNDYIKHHRTYKDPERALQYAKKKNPSPI